MGEFQTNQVNGLALVREQRHRVRDLSGFKKNLHKVPTEVSERTQVFVGRIAYQEISADLDARFAEFRQHFAFRRSELRVSEPDEGTAAIGTPWFDYRVTMRHSDDDFSETILRQQVTDFREPEALFSSEFATVFGTLFDTVEFDPPDAIHVDEFIDHLEDRADESLRLDYDRTASWCQLKADRIPGELHVTAERISLKTQQPELPSLLLKSFFQFHDCLVRIDWF